MGRSARLNPPSVQDEAVVVPRLVHEGAENVPVPEVNVMELDQTWQLPVLMTHRPASTISLPVLVLTPETYGISVQLVGNARSVGRVRDVVSTICGR